MRSEHEYERGGALEYLAAWDVSHGRVLGRCEEKTGIDSFGRLVEQAVKTEPYRSASRVFWIVDNGSSHRGQTAVQRLRKAYRKAVLVHTPVHASWLNQVEIEFSIIQKKVLTPNDFASLRRGGAATEAVRGTEQSTTAPLRLEVRSSRLVGLPDALGGQTRNAARRLCQLILRSSCNAYR
jgi:hypothetical protein